MPKPSSNAFNQSNPRPETDAQAFRAQIVSLRLRRAERKALTGRRTRRSPKLLDRKSILAKTASQCHICGGLVDDMWQADHVLAHSGGGQSNPENYLPSHALCNNYRWDYLPEEFQIILKLGVWARTQVEQDSALGREVSRQFAAYEKKRAGRRKAMTEGERS